MKENQTSLLYNIDDIPPLGETLILGFQHYLTMFGSTVAIHLLLSPAFGLDDPIQKGWLIATRTIIVVGKIPQIFHSKNGKR